jgi:F-type H+-transporting ATPase subunit alpha
MIDIKNIGEQLKSKIDTFTPEIHGRTTGTVIYCGDGIIKISGLGGVKYNEILEIEGGYHAMALNLEKESVGAVLFDGESKVKYGDTVYSSGRIIEMNVGAGLLGRIVSPLGEPMDGKGDLKNYTKRAIEFPAPAIMDRDKVSEPLQTGILSIDSMIPIGRGQRELIIGDRQTGKTAIAIDTILNQKGRNVFCVYVAIGQKASTVSNIVKIFREHGAMEYTTIICSTANDPAPLQYLAPYSGCAVAEDIMYKGKAALIVYDDLSKHAVSYRTMSLLLKRPAGREAYPGDVFYLHSRLLERAAKLNDKLGGGSMTALPIVETQAGDISAYIPTNVISITDGQIFLESELFNAGVRPAVNVGLSVSRVGGAAQLKAMRQISGQLRLNLAQYRELAIFTQFGSELDKSTQEILSSGDKLMETLKQQQYLNYNVEDMIILLTVAQSDEISSINTKAMQSFNKGLLNHIKATANDIYEDLEKEKNIGLSKELKEKILAASKDYISYLQKEENE